MKTESHKASLRCAVYTRVSTEHGLKDLQLAAETADWRQQTAQAPSHGNVGLFRTLGNYVSSVRWSS